MQIALNGKPHQLSDGATLSSLVQALGLTDKRFAIEVNAHIIPASQHAAYELQSDDEVEIIHAIGGG